VQRDPTITTLATCGHACLQARNGHHRRWAVKRCTDALVAAGTPPTIAARSALAMAAIGARLADMAADAALRGRCETRAASSDVAALKLLTDEVRAVRQDAAAVSRWPGVQRVATQSSGPVPDTGSAAPACG